MVYGLGLKNAMTGTCLSAMGATKIAKSKKITHVLEAQAQLSIHALVSVEMEPETQASSVMTRIKL